MVHLTAAGATAVATAVAKAIFGDADDASALNTTTRWSEENGEIKMEDDDVDVKRPAVGSQRSTRILMRRIE